MRRRLTNLGLLAAGIGLALLLGEGALRLVGPGMASAHVIGGFTRYDPELGWVLDPARAGTFQGAHFAVQVATSPQGLRDRVYPVERTPGVRRILVLGDSVAWCWGVEMDDCFTKVAERLLAPAEVITMGVPGYGTAQELLLYERDGARFRPDQVVLMFTDNDPMENMDGRRRPRFVLEDGALRLTNVPVPRRKGALGEWLSAHSLLYMQARQGAQVLNHLGRRLRGTVAAAEDGGFERVGPAWDREAWELTRALLDRLQEVVEAHGGQLVLGVASPHASEYDRLMAHAAARGLGAVDLAAAIRAAQAAGIDTALEGDPHFSVAGNRVLGEALAAGLAALDGSSAAPATGAPSAEAPPAPSP